MLLPERRKVSMRDAQSQLDQIIAFCGDAIKDEQVRDLLGIVPQQMLEDFTNAIVQQDARKVLMLIDQLVCGLNLQHFVREMLGHFRNLLMLKIAGDDPKLIPFALRGRTGSRRRPIFQRRI